MKVGKVIEMLKEFDKDCELLFAYDGSPRGNIECIFYFKGKREEINTVVLSDRKDRRRIIGV